MKDHVISNAFSQMGTPKFELNGPAALQLIVYITCLNVCVPFSEINCLKEGRTFSWTLGAHMMYQVQMKYCTILTLKVLVATIDALGHFETG